MTVNSKLTPISLTCFEYAHPWQASCTLTAAGVLIHTFQYGLKTNSAVYLCVTLICLCTCGSLYGVYPAETAEHYAGALQKKDLSPFTPPFSPKWYFTFYYSNLSIRKLILSKF